MALVRSPLKRKCGPGRLRAVMVPRQERPRDAGPEPRWSSQLVTRWNSPVRARASPAQSIPGGGREERAVQPRDDRSLPPSRSADGVHDEVAAGAAAEIAGDRLADLGVGRVRILVEQRFGGEQDAGRAESALKPVVVPERLLQGMQPFAVDQSIWIASSRQPRTGSPSSSTVQAPQTPCSQPT